MPVRIEKRNGTRRLVIDIRYRRGDGTWARHRRDSAAATMSAAREEERRIRERIARTGSPLEQSESSSSEDDGVTYQEVVAEYRRDFMPTELKVSTRTSYNAVLSQLLLPAFGDEPVRNLTGQMIEALDCAFAKERGHRQQVRARASRNNVQIVMRSTLRFACQRGYLDAMPQGLPRLKRVEKTVLEIPTDEEVEAILKKAAVTQRRAFMLMAYGGLRPNEVRGLLWQDVRFGDSRKPSFLTVRFGVSRGERHSPKTGQRDIPLAPPLEKELRLSRKRPRDVAVALTARGMPWGDWGLNQAFKRTMERVGLSGWTAYYLRHYAITAWLRALIPVHVVQQMAGHTNLSTTQGYVHYLRGDLEMAAQLIGNMLATPSSSSPADSPERP